MIDKKGNSLKIWWSGRAFLMRSHVSIETRWEEYFFKGSSMYKGPVAGKISVLVSRKVRVLRCTA